MLELDELLDWLLKLDWLDEELMLDRLEELEDWLDSDDELD